MIPVAERLGLVRMLDHRVLELLISEMMAVPTLTASLNVSPASITDPDWWTALGAMLRANTGVAERLIIEITETAAIQDIDDTRGFVTRVKDLGCRIAIDDFGAGYTSFRNLRKLGVDIIKIDGAYVQNLTRSEDDRAFVLTLVDLAKRLGLKTIAEWVQDEASAALLTQWGCDYLQGALVGLASVERPWGNAVPADRRKTRASSPVIPVGVRQTHGVSAAHVRMHQSVDHECRADMDAVLPGVPAMRFDRLVEIGNVNRRGDSLTPL